MKTELYQIRKELEDRKNKIGLVGVLLNVNENEGNIISAYITTNWRTIGISYGKDLDLIPDKETERFVKTRGIKDVKLKTGEDILEHEAGHRENKVGEKYGCPHDIETHELIKDSIAKGLIKIGRQGLEHYVTNAFEDVLDNINCRRHTDFAGQTLFWNNQGLVNPEEGKFNPFYEAFVKINLILGGKIADYSLLKRFFSNSHKVKESLDKFLKELRLELTEENLVRLHEKPAFDVLFNPKDKKKRAELWARLGYSFALNLGKLLENLPQQRMFGSQEGDENSPEQNPFDREMKMPSNRQKIALDRYKECKTPAAHRDTIEQLYDFYKGISKEIKVETSHYSHSQSMPLVKFGRRFIKEDEQKFKFKGIGFKEDGVIGIKTSKHALKHPVAYKIHLHKFPKFKLALMDRSESMALSPNNDKNIGSTIYIPWGDKSKYHFALKGYFGIDNFLERQGIAQYVESSVLGFSGEEALRGKSEKLARKLLVKPKGSTSLDVSGLERELEENTLILSISDGELSLTDEEKQRFEKKIQNCDYAHIQIGDETDFSSYVKRLNIPIIYVKGDEDLSKAMVSFVSSYYKNKQGERR